LNSGDFTRPPARTGCRSARLQATGKINLHLESARPAGPTVFHEHGDVMQRAWICAMSGALSARPQMGASTWSATKPPWTDGWQQT